MMKLSNLSDEEIDALLLHLFNEGIKPPLREPNPHQKKSVHELTDADLRRIRSRNHPDKFPNVNLETYRAAVAELDRRRNLAKTQK